MKKITPYLYGAAAAAGIIAAAGTASYVLYDAAGSPSPYLTENNKVADHNAQIILEHKCASCHGANAEYSYLLNLLSFGKMRRDVEGAQRAFLLHPAAKDTMSIRSGNVDYLKMDKVLRTRRMPPVAYTAVHIGSRLTPEDIALLRCRYKEDAALHRAFAPIQPAAEPADDIERLRRHLGHRLFFDGRLSTTNEIACASCHDLTLGGTDNKPKSEGVPGADGKPQLGGVNAPTVYNAAGNIRQFWDGRAADLQEQAGGPPLNPVEMGYATEEDWEAIAAKLRQDPELVAFFALIYGQKGITAETITDAIAAFEKTLVTPDSPFDRYLKGDASALADDQIKGMEEFVRFGCATCHSGPALGGISFEYISTHAPFHAYMPADYEEGAHGLADFTKESQHHDMFRVPTLRNVALTAPYFHTGAVPSLQEAVRIMFDTQVGCSDVGETTILNVTRFLEAQTGKLNGKPLDQLTPDDVKPGWNH